ncbi:MAG: hypothetical protein JST36_10795 [Bacteroidetes bacterium]|nr:hypothetical protein [Bacteroidota bacterium]
MRPISAGVADTITVVTPIYIQYFYGFRHYMFDTSDAMRILLGTLSKHSNTLISTKDRAVVDLRNNVSLQEFFR